MFRITARTVLELGSELISSDIIAFYELIKNGFDAGSDRGVELRFDIALPRHAHLKLQQRIAAAAPNAGESTDEPDLKAATAPGGMPDVALADNVDDLKEAVAAALLSGASAEAKNIVTSAVETAGTFAELASSLAEAHAACNTISVLDRGSGMSMVDLGDAFLVIGTASRKREVDAALKAGAARTPYLGEKGIGRLSAMRLGERLRVETARADDVAMNLLEIDWRDFGAIDAMLDEVPVSPAQGGPKPNAAWSGTRLVVGDLGENWTEARVREMCEYDFARLTDPTVGPEKRPRIAIFWNGERVAVPFMPKRLLDAAHARVTGNYRIDDGRPSLTCTIEAIDLDFDHPHEAETVVLAPEDLQDAIIGIDGDLEDAALTSVGPFTFEAHWFNRRRLSRVDTTGETRGLRDLQDQWSGILLFRDGFRVFPYGEEDDDWLELDRRALRRSGYTLNKTQFIGRVNISRTGNRDLIDQTNREGLRVTPEQQVFQAVLRYAVQDRLFDFLKFVEGQHKAQKIDLTDAKTRVAGLENRARAAIKRLRRVAGPDGGEAVDELQQTLLELSDFAEMARIRIGEVEQESRQMIDMAGVGLMVEVVAHELARSSENALKALERLKGTEVPERLRAHFNTLRAEMKSVSKRIRILDPLSVSGRQRAEAFALDALIRETMEAHEAQFERHRVQLDLDLGDRPLRVRAVKGMVVQILENLISNAVHWMDARAERDPGYMPRIRITLERGPPMITFEDNGRGVAPENAEKVFRAFFSLKEEKRRRGLGLFIAREAAQHHGGTLILSEQANPETRRLHRFVLELPAGSEA